ncbi:alkaline ceramidase [Anaerotignum propionicum]|uniref:alkaline ceramidase n=1 Tax=Anaerotignum propionicum TaxID=28446 RepID=UPI00289C4551|nr:alkaline ceramidase [Anaerotignum propionicum]
MKNQRLSETNDVVHFAYEEVDITPQEPMQTIGFGREDEESIGVMDRLLAQVSLWKYQKEICCLIAIDHIGFSKVHGDILRRAIGKVLGVEQEKVMLCFSHTHSAPNDTIEKEYAEFVDNQIMKAVGLALKKFMPMKGAWGNAYGDIGLNRRWDNDALDRRIGFFKVIDAESGDLKLLLLRLTAHANVLKGDNYLISPDYFGTVRDALQQRFGCPVMVTQGASGDVAPKYFNSKLTPPDAGDDRFVRSEKALSLMAQEVLKQISAVIDNIAPAAFKGLGMYSVELDLFADMLPYERALKIAKEAKQFAGIDGTLWLAEVLQLQKSGIKTQKETIEIQYFSIGNGCLCGVANEIMCEFALHALELTGNEYFYFGGYTNGCTGYFPTEAEYDKGGFEVYWSMLIYYIYFNRVFPLNRDACTLLIQGAVENAPL